MADDNVHVQITGSVAGLVAAMEEGAAVVKGATAEMTGAVKTMTAGIESAMGPLIALFALFETFHVITDAVDQIRELAVQMDILSAKTGMTVEALSALHGAATLGNISTEELDGGMQKLAKSMAIAATGVGSQADAFKRLGISVTDANGHLIPTRDMLLQLATRFSTLNDGVEKTAVGVELFGRGFDAMGQFLNKGAEGIQALEEQATELGGVMTREAQQSLLAYDDALDRIEVSTGALKRELVTGLAPALTTIAEGFTAGVGGMQAMRDAGEKLGMVLKGVVALFLTMNLSMNVFHGLASGGLGGAAAALREYREEMEKLFKAVDPLANDPALFALLNPAKTDMVPIKKAGGPSKMDQMREEWNVIKEANLNGEADLLAMEIKFWAEKLAITTKGTADYLAIHSHLVDLEEQINKRNIEQQKKAAKEVQDRWVATFDAIPKAWEQAIRGMRNTTASWGAFFKGILRSLALDYAAFEARQVVIHNAAWLEKKKATIAGYALEMVQSAISTAVAVANYAYVAAAAAWAAMAGIPFVGPFLAPAVAFGTLAAVFALASGIHSAAGGYDVPAGTNPLTQLHAQEMVLPAELANKVRGMTDGEGGGGNTYHIHAMDAKSFADFADRNYGTFAKAVQKAAKYGAR